MAAHCTTCGCAVAGHPTMGHGITSATDTELVVGDHTPACTNCGNDLGPYNGLCLDCLEALT